MQVDVAEPQCDMDPYVTVVLQDLHLRSVFLNA